MRHHVARLGVATVAVATLVVVAALPAFAVGAGGVEMTVQLQRTSDDRLLLEVGDDPVTTTVTLTNTTDEPRTAELYAVTAQVDGAAVALGSPGSGSWLGLEPTTVELAPGQVEQFTFTTRPSDLPEGDGDRRHAALVLEIDQSASVVLRAASVVRVQGTHALPPHLMALVAVATVLLIGAVYALSREVRRRRRARRAPLTSAAAAA